MLKQNRPYNLLNIYDNLHAAYKKPALETALNDLTAQGKLTCKEYGKNKVYFIQQDTFTVSLEEVETLTTEMTALQANRQEKQEEFKKSMEEFKAIAAMKTKEELKHIIQELKAKITQL